MYLYFLLLLYIKGKDKGQKMDVLFSLLYTFDHIVYKQFHFEIGKILESSLDYI